MSARRWSVDTFRKHERIALDANVLIYLMEDVEPQASRSTAILDAIDAGLTSASISTIVGVEVLTGPARSGDATVFESTAATLRDLPLRQVPLTAELAADAAWIRGGTGLRLADAIHLASARAAGATAFVTNDRRIRSDDSLAVLYLDDLDLSEPVAPEPG